MKPSQKKSVASDSTIRWLVKEHGLLEKHCEKGFQGASYDLRLGPQYAKQGQVRALADDNRTIVIEPGEFCVLTTYEVIRMPVDMIGHNGIMSPWAKRGLVSLFSPQIDPGFCGMLVVPVFNAGDASISITLREPIFTVEFVWLDKPATYGWSERHGEQRELRVGPGPVASRPSLSDIGKMQSDLRKMEDDIRLLNVLASEMDKRLSLTQSVTSTKYGRKQVTWTWVAIVVGILLVVVVTPLLTLLLKTLFPDVKW